MVRFGVMGGGGGRQYVIGGGGNLYPNTDQRCSARIPQVMCIPILTTENETSQKTGTKRVPMQHCRANKYMRTSEACKERDSTEKQSHCNHHTFAP